MFGLDPWELLRGNPRRLNFVLSCAAVLQRFDIEQENSRRQFDVDRDDAARKFQAAMWGVKLEDSPSKTPKPSPPNGQKKTMTQEDIMRNYRK
jgi:hypothetical protein